MGRPRHLTVGWCVDPSRLERIAHEPERAIGVESVAECRPGQPGPAKHLLGRGMIEHRRECRCTARGHVTGVDDPPHARVAGRVDGRPDAG